VVSNATPTCDTQGMAGNDIADRLLDARTRLDALRGDVEARAPWPASENFGAEPESSWYPPELLAHVAEMVPYWMAQIERILEGYPEPVPFGRVQTDEERIAAIGRDRALPVGELFDRIDAGTEAAAGRLGELSAEQFERRGTHPTRGEMTVGAVVESMLIHHIGEHVEQLDAILGTPEGG
jgi:DinB superfamily